MNNVEGIKNINVFATKVAIIKTNDEIHGVVLKGVASDYDWTFFNDIGTWIFETVLLPLWEWLKLLWKDPTQAIANMWTFLQCPIIQILHRT